eukprot:3330935-Amphidinium_carterae.1
MPLAWVSLASPPKTSGRPSRAETHKAAVIGASLRNEFGVVEGVCCTIRAGRLVLCLFVSVPCTRFRAREESIEVVSFFPHPLHPE